MKNKAYYFSHDGNAHNDVKIQYLISDLGMEGYGIFWFIIEKLFDAGGILPLKIIKILSNQMNVSEAKVKTVIQSYDLFVISDESFYSQRLIRHFETKKILSESGKRGAQIKWKNYGHPNGEANGHPISHPNGHPIYTPIARKEKKRKESLLENYEHDENTVFEEKKVDENFMCYNVEEMLQSNKPQLEAICMKTKKSLANAQEELMKCHLHLEKKEMYPMQKKAALAWFTSWLLNSEGFNAKYGAVDKAKKQASDVPKKSIDEIIKKYQ